MSTEDLTERTSHAEQEELDLIRQATRSLAELSTRIAPHFGRAEVVSRVGRYLRGLLATVERKNGCVVCRNNFPCLDNNFSRHILI